MTNHNMTYDLQDLQDIVKTLETDTTVVNEITLAKNMIKSPDFNYLEMPDDAPFISSFIPTLQELENGSGEKANIYEAILVRDTVNFIFFHEHANHPELNPNLDQVFESIHQSLMSENSDIFQLENFSLIPNLADLDDLDALDDLDWIDLLLHSKAEIRILTEMGKRNIKDRDMDSYTSADLLNEGLCSLEHDTITTSQGFNLLALNSIFEQCKFFLVQQSGTLESALLSTKHLLLSQASNHLAKEQVIFFYEERGESGTHKLQQIIDQREKLNHLIRSSKGGKKVPWFYELFYERAKQFIREIWLDDLKNGLTILRSGHAIPILRNLHEMKYEAAKELIPDDSTIERYIKEVHKYMELPPHKKGRLKPLDRNYNHLKETFEHIIHKPIETLRLENYPSKEKFLPVKNHGC